MTGESFTQGTHASVSSNVELNLYIATNVVSYMGGGSCLTFTSVKEQARRNSCFICSVLAMHDMRVIMCCHEQHDFVCRKG